MENNRLQIKKVIAGLFLGFIVVFVICFVYSFTLPPKMIEEATSSVQEVSYLHSISNNFQEIHYQGKNFLSDGNVHQLQAFERTATFQTQTEHFDADRQQVYALAKEYQARIKLEEYVGVKPYRQLKIVIGVECERFDDVFDRLSKIGELQSVKSQKVDKTEEFRQSLAHKKSLETYRDALDKLRSHQGNIDELTRLEEKIMGLEKEIQLQTIRVGDFIQEQSFCDVAYSLAEKKLKEVAPYPLSMRAWDAFRWGIMTYFGGIFAFAIVYLTIFSIQLLRRK